jgi:hypothetical protein
MADGTTDERTVLVGFLQILNPATIGAPGALAGTRVFIVSSRADADDGRPILSFTQPLNVCVSLVGLEGPFSFAFAPASTRVYGEIAFFLSGDDACAAVTEPGTFAVLRAQSVAEVEDCPTISALASTEADGANVVITVTASGGALPYAFQIAVPADLTLSGERVSDDQFQYTLTAPDAPLEPLTISVIDSFGCAGESTIGLEPAA